MKTLFDVITILLVQMLINSFIMPIRRAQPKGMNDRNLLPGLVCHREYI
jgi:hypothetical protein